MVDGSSTSQVERAEPPLKGDGVSKWISQPQMRYPGAQWEDGSILMGEGESIPVFAVHGRTYGSKDSPHPV